MTSWPVSVDGWMLTLTVCGMVHVQVETSFFKSYYSTLPSTLRNMPIFWSEEELSWLKGSYIIQQIQERKAAIRKDYDVICRVSACL